MMTLFDGKEYDPSTDEGYRKIVEVISEVRKNINSGFMNLYSAILGVDTEQLLDTLYEKATEIHNAAKAKIEEAKRTEAERLAKETREEVEKVVNEYVNKLKTSENDATLEAAKSVLIEYTAWLFNRIK